MQRMNGKDQATDFHRDQRLPRKLSVVVLILSAGTIVDLIFDQPHSLWSAHVLFELALLSFGLSAVVYFWLQWRDTGGKLVASRAALAAGAAERDAWRARTEKLLAGLGVEIHSQFRRWGLTPAESETALLILKGYGHKEIAALQGKSERTVRQHAIAIYRKSGLSNRAELAAFFLEDLLLPTGESLKQAS